MYNGDMNDMPLFLTFNGPINDVNVAQLMQQVDPMLGVDKI